MGSQTGSRRAPPSSSTSTRSTRGWFSAEFRRTLGALETLKGKGFSVKLPCIPAGQKQKVEARTGESLSGMMYLCEGAESAYAIHVLPLRPQMQYDLDEGARGSADALNGKVVQSRRVTYAGVPARDVRITSTSDGERITTFMRFMVHERRLFMVLYAVEGEVKNPSAKYRKVLKSLKFR